jgi:hypothetical protein
MKMSKALSMNRLFRFVLSFSYIVFAFAFSDNVTLYSDVTLVNTSDSLQRLKALPIVYYKFLYDSIQDRIQLGVIGPEAQKLFPESIEVLPSTAFVTAGNKNEVNSASSSPDQKPLQPVTVTNFPIVDKNVLYMHGLAAIQELIKQFHDLQFSLNTLVNHSGDYKKEFYELQQIIQKESDHQLIESLEIIKLELLAKEKEMDLENTRLTNEKEKLSLTLVEEKKLLEFEESLSKERLKSQEEITKNHLEKQLNYEKEILEKKELLIQQNSRMTQSLKEAQLKELEKQKLINEKEKISLELESKLNQEKLNEEIAIRKLELQSKLDTDRMITSIKNISQQIIFIFQNIFAHPKQLVMIAVLILLLIFNYFFIKELSNLIRQFIQSNLGKPLLVRETSYHWSFFVALEQWRKMLSGILFFFFTSRNGKDDNQITFTLRQLEEEFANIILSKDDKDRVINLALATKNTKQSGAPYRHVLLHGPPGNYF